MNRLPTKDDWIAWLGQEPTKALQAVAEKQIASLKNQWANGNFSHPSDTATLMKNAEALGAVKAWSLLLELDYEMMITELGED